MELYLKLEAYPEVKEVLEKLKDKKYKTGILSNGSIKMLDSAVKNAKIENLLDEVISVEECKIYKPSSDVYDLVEKKTNIKKDKIKINTVKKYLFISAKSKLILVKINLFMNIFLGLLNDKI